MHIVCAIGLLGWASGGCPQGANPLEPGDNGNPSENAGGSGEQGSNGAGGIVAAATSEAGELRADDLDIQALRNQPTTIRLRGHGEDPAALSFEIVAPPGQGVLGEIVSFSDGSAQVEYSPPADFVGEAQFSYRVRAGVRQSDAATVRLRVFPDVRFTIERLDGQLQLDGPRDLTVRLSAISVDADSLPEGTYTWTVDGDSSDSGPLASHFVRTRTFSAGGPHAVSLALTIAGISAPLACVSSQTGQRTANVTVWPVISGRIVDSSGSPRRGVAVRGGSGGLVAVTDGDGVYRLHVPFGWSGDVIPETTIGSFDPPRRSVLNLAADLGRVGDQQSMDFIAIGLPDNQPPIANAGPDINVVDADGNGSEAVALEGTASFDPDGSIISYTWLEGVNVVAEGATASPTLSVGSHTLTLRVVDNLLASGEDTLVVQVGTIGSNNPPTVNNGSTSTNEDTARVITLTGSDLDGDDLNFEIVTGPAHGSLGALNNSAMNSATVTYTPAGNYSGPDSFTFRANDGQLNSPNGRFDITVTAVNDPPQIANGATTYLVVQQNSQSSDPNNRVTLTATDPDAAGNGLMWTVLSGPAHGVAALVSGSPSSSGGTVVFSYGPAAGYTGTDSFVVRVVDSGNSSDTITVAVTVGGYPIAGMLVDYAGAGRGNVPLVATDLSGQTTSQTASAADGSYVMLVPMGWSGTISSDENYRLEPASRSYTNVSAVVAGQDYSAYRNYYVAMNGSDAAGGTRAQPYSSIQRGTNAAYPGDTVYLRGGDFVGGATRDITFARSGRPGQPIRVEAYENELVRVSAGAEAAIVFLLGDKNQIDGIGSHQHGFGHFEFRKLKIFNSRHGWEVYFATESDNPANLAYEQAKAIHDVVIEDCELWACQSAMKTRNAGIHRLTVRRTRVHDMLSTEGGWDFGEWLDQTNPVFIDTPRSASHDLVFEDCDSYDNNVNQPLNGWVFQPCTYNVTLRRCRTWNNAKYGFACKGSGNFKLDRCAAWGNGNSQMYLKGMTLVESGTPRTPFHNNFQITNSVFIGASNVKALDIRENVHLDIYNSTMVCFSGPDGYTSGSNVHQEIPTSLWRMRNCLFVAYGTAQVARYRPSSSTFLENVRYEAGTNLFWQGTVNDNYMSYCNSNWNLAEWRNYWATGELNGNDGALGPRATHADATSIFMDPLFRGVAPTAVPAARQWTSDFLADCDVRVELTSPAVGLGDNLTVLGIPELTVDYLGQPRYGTGAWTAGAFNP